MRLRWFTPFYCDLPSSKDAADDEWHGRAAADAEDEDDDDSAAQTYKLGGGVLAGVVGALMAAL